ncbi:MAG: alpha/beta hydrolase [Flavobacteriales bacterium]
MKKVFLYAVLPLVLIGFLLVHFYVPRFITEIKIGPVDAQIQKMKPELGTAFSELQPNGKELIYTSRDGLKLAGYISYSNTHEEKGTIIFLHGIRSDRNQFKNLAKSMADFGFNSVALDLRAHAASEGTHCTFGVKEKEDIEELIDYLEDTESLSSNYGVWGMSLGGAVAFQSLANDPRLQFGIIECTFSNYRIVIKDYIKRILGVDIPWFADYLIQRSGSIADFDPDQANPVDIATQITQPVLVFHGTEDANIDISYGKQNFDSISSKDKTWVPLEGGTHYLITGNEPKLYSEKLSAFLNNIAN